jgi:phospholipid transport system substrate-binding protein
MKFRQGMQSFMALFFTLFMALPATAGQPTEQLRSTVDALVAALSAPRATAAPGPELRDQLGRLIAARFDFVEMAKRALGSHWEARSQEERAEFVKLFSTLLEKFYGRALSSYGGEKFAYSGESRQGNDAEVRTRVVQSSGADVSIDYRLQSAGSEWKVYDVVIDHVSLVENYRSQFNRIITASSFENLLQRMRT